MTRYCQIAKPNKNKFNERNDISSLAVKVVQRSVIKRQNTGPLNNAIIKLSISFEIAMSN